MSDDASTAAPAEGEVEVTPFSAENLVAHFTRCTDSLDRIPHDAFLSGCAEVEKLLGTLGPALAIASSEINGKVSLMQERFQQLQTRIEAKEVEGSIEMAGTVYEAGQHLQFIVVEEISRGVAGENSWTYVAASRTLLRLVWFLDFVHTLLDNLIANPEEELASCASRAYEATLAPRHGWILRNTIYAAMMTLPYREDFIVSVGQGSKDGVMDNFVRCSAVMETLRTSLWAFFRKHEAHELP